MAPQSNSKTTARETKERRRQEAESRQAQHARLSLQEQLRKAESNGHSGTKEVIRLKKLLAQNTER